jgi:hypothetical protein
MSHYSHKETEISATLLIGGCGQYRISILESWQLWGVAKNPLVNNLCRYSLTTKVMRYKLGWGSGIGYYGGLD